MPIFKPYTEENIQDAIRYYCENINLWAFYNVDENPCLGGHYITCHKQGLLRTTQTTCGECEFITVVEIGSANSK